LADLLIKNGANWQIFAGGARRIEDGEIELFENWAVDFIVEIDGICVASLACIRKQKAELGRQKDWEDIELIDKRLMPPEGG
jgi:hypothetical protein